MQVLIRTDRIMVEQLDSPDMSEGGIVLPNQSKVKQAWAVVLKIGPDVEDIEEGDRIAFADFSGVNVELETDEGKREFLILSQDDVLLVLRNDEQGLNKQELDDGRDNDTEEVEPGPLEGSRVHKEVESSGSDV